VAVPGAELYVREVGSGIPLIVVHGGPDFNHAYLLPEMDRLAADARVIYYDQRGRGRSSRGVVPEDVGIDSEIEDLDHVGRHAGGTSIALLGHSWGGLLAMEYATRHPAKVSHLILLNTSPASHDDLMALQERRRGSEAEVLAAMQTVASRPAYVAGDIATEAEYYRLHFSAAFHDGQHLERVVRRLRVDFTPSSIVLARAIEARLYQQTWLAPDYDLLARLRRTTVPTLVIHGDRDLVPLACARRVVAAVPAARSVVLRECGHFAFVERPDDVVRVVGDAASRSGFGRAATASFPRCGPWWRSRGDQVARTPRTSQPRAAADACRAPAAGADACRAPAAGAHPRRVASSVMPGSFTVTRSKAPARRANSKRERSCRRPTLSSLSR
jgi:proline iminopeptidase